jgi:hypothetical protein
MKMQGKNHPFSKKSKFPDKPLFTAKKRGLLQQGHLWLIKPKKRGKS